MRENETSKILVYPNPTSEFLTIELADRFSKFKLEVMDLTGHMVLEISNLTPISTLDISSLSSGIYYLRISSTADIYSTKVVKL